MNPSDRLKESGRSRDKQKEVETYNRNLKNLDSKLKEKVFVNRTVIVRLRKDDYVTEVIKSVVLGNTEVKKSNKIFIETKGGESKLIDTPLPYLPEGILVDFDPTLKESYPFLEIGSYVELADFDLESRMYYIDNSKCDIKIEIDEIMAGVNPYSNYEGYVKISPSLIEAVTEVPKACK
tara:strand:+ start:2994 stop:3530 length:537 start_codon:yes stop_codon:yes gene_type:complete